MTPIIEVDHASKRYRPRRSARILLGHGGLAELFRRDKEPAEEVVALRDVSFSVEPGESVGLIGANGSGKSTLLKLLAGVAVPTSGHVTVRGRVASLLELGAGFHPMLTGRENVYLNAGLLGMRHAEVDKVFDEIVAFSGIGDAIDQPVDTYSSGMYVRLGFAVAAHVNPDIFLVDEVLSVGDEAFQRKCRTRIAELRDQGKTILFVSHDLSIVNLLCNRVVLLNRGEVVTRGTPRDTIDYYLRQIGQEKGIHTLKSERAEAIVSHGRISVFLDQREVSAPSGLQVEVRCLEQSHGSTMAEWEVIERSPSHCVTRGRMTKLPASYVWDVRLEGTQLTWSIALDCERDVQLDLLDANVFLPTAYTHWYYGANPGMFPAMTPGDLAWTMALLPTATCRYAALLPSDSSHDALLAVHAEAHKPYFRLALLNTDYFTGCRVIQAGGRIPADDQPLKAGLHSFMTLRFELAASRSEIEAHSEECIVRQGSYAAAFKDGQIHLTQNGQPLSAGPHVYSALLAGNLWNPSTALQWTSIRREGDRLIARGESRRLPYTQEWELFAVESGFALTIWIEPREPLSIQEYQVSTCLVESYDRWETDCESGEFPPLTPSQMDWRHANRDYAPGAGIRAFAETMPCVSMRVTAADIPFRMTAVNTSYQEHARVLQALRTPDHGMVNFMPGRQLYFAGIIEIASQGHSA